MRSSLLLRAAPYLAALILASPAAEIASKLKATLEEGFRQTAYGEHLLTVIVVHRAEAAAG